MKLFSVSSPSKQEFLQFFMSCVSVPIRVIPGLMMQITEVAYVDARGRLDLFVSS
jgi:hypothetical protein